VLCTGPGSEDLQSSVKAHSEQVHFAPNRSFRMTLRRRTARAERPIKTTELPTKLKVDGVQGALFEIRFRSDLTPEVFTGQLAGKLGTAERLPVADIPFPIRRSDANLAYQAILQVRSDRRVAKIGEQVFSWHVFPPYPGWQAFKGEIESRLGLLRETIPDLIVTRLGFRYINLLALAHGIRSFGDLNLHVEVAGEPLSGPLNLNYKLTSGGQDLLVRIATREFVQGPNPASLNVAIDLDVATEKAPLPDLASDTEWTENAHAFLKTQFFRLLKAKTVRDLRES
jgi:uncharacterized protein (TIGR04255 family)